MTLQKTLWAASLTFTLSLLVSWNSQAGHPTGNTSCNCGANLDTLVSNTEQHYAGFPAKVSTSTRPAYTALVARLERKARTTTDNYPCYLLLEQYVRFFRDKHFTVSLQGHQNRVIRKALPMQPVPAGAPAFAGTWMDADSSLQLEVTPVAKGEFEARVSWAKDQRLYPVGLLYSTFRQREGKWISQRFDWFTSTDIPVTLTGNLLREWNLRVFGRLSKMTANERSELVSWAGNANGLAFFMADEKTVCLRVPSFNNDEQVARLVAASDSAIRSHPNLIIDLRGNGGGNTGWVHFLPYLMTNEIRQPESELRVTDKNRGRTLADLIPIVNSPLPDEYKKYFPDSVMALYRYSLEQLKTTQNDFLKLPSVYFPFDSASRWPGRVALLFDEACGSSTEYFFEISKQSKKASRYGVHTLGMMDYIGMNHPTILPASEFYVSMPMACSGWTTTRPIDETGFIPENALGEIPRSEWIKEVCKRMNNAGD